MTNLALDDVVHMWRYMALQVRSRGCLRCRDLNKATSNSDAKQSLGKIQHQETLPECISRMSVLHGFLQARALNLYGSSVFAPLFILCYRRSPSSPCSERFALDARH